MKKRKIQIEIIQQGEPRPKRNPGLLGSTDRRTVEERSAVKRREKRNPGTDFEKILGTSL